jgi:hypothetical protein
MCGRSHSRRFFAIMACGVPSRSPPHPLELRRCVLISVAPFFLHIAPATPHYPSTSTKSLSGKIPVEFPGEKEKDAATLVVFGVASSRSWRIPGCAKLVARLNLGWLELSPRTQFCVMLGGIFMCIVDLSWSATGMKTPIAGRCCVAAVSAVFYLLF